VALRVKNFISQTELSIETCIYYVKIRNYFHYRN